MSARSSKKDDSLKKRVVKFVDEEVQWLLGLVDYELLEEVQEKFFDLFLFEIIIDFLGLLVFLLSIHY